MEKRRKKVKVHVGDVVAVPLPIGGFAYLRILRDGDFEVFKCHSASLLDVSEVAKCPVSHYVVGTDEAIRKGLWPAIGTAEFDSEEMEWAPPFATYYAAQANLWTMGGPKISHRGQVRDATLEEVAGLEVLSVANRPELIVDSIVRRMINGDESRVHRVPKP